MNYSPTYATEASPSTHDLLLSVYRLYRQYFRRWFGITAPTSLLAAAVLLITRQGGTIILRSLPRGAEFFEYPRDFIEVLMLDAGGFFSAWLLGCFTLGAVATIVARLQEDDIEPAFRRDGYDQVREQVQPLLFLAILTLVAFSLGAVILAFIEYPLLHVLRRHGSWQAMSVAVSAGYLVVAGVLSWFGMAIPLLIRSNIRGWAALKLSMKLSDGHEAYLFLLVLESLAGSYVAGLAVQGGIRILSPNTFVPADWLPLILYFTTALASAAVQPPMFIGFSLLAQAHPVE